MPSKRQPLCHRYARITQRISVNRIRNNVGGAGATFDSDMQFNFCLLCDYAPVHMEVGDPRKVR